MKEHEAVALQKENEILRQRLENRNRELQKLRAKIPKLAQEIKEELEQNNNEC